LHDSSSLIREWGALAIACLQGQMLIIISTSSLYDIPDFQKSGKEFLPATAPHAFAFWVTNQTLGPVVSG
jgi:hypothetical protein